MKKIFLMLILILFFLTSCSEKPYDTCSNEWDSHMEEKALLVVSYTTYWLDFEEGSVQVAKKIYENALNGDYSEVCITVYPDDLPTFKGAILLDGTPLDQNIVEELQEQIKTDEE
jgi:uncharacterized protein YcfL